VSAEGARDGLYVCGHSARELERLELQAAFYEDITRSLLQDAGLAAGMRVLDIGCGAGDVSFLAARLVGPAGSVLGVDRDSATIAHARGRAAAQEATNVDFRVSALDALELDTPVDALVGRFVLMHQVEPAAALRRAARQVRGGGIVAVLESCMSASVPGVHSWPHSPTYDRIVRWMIDVVRAAGAHADMGYRLRSTFLDAGLPEPQLRMEARVEGGPDAAIYRYVIESLRSMLPLARTLELVEIGEHEVMELESRLRNEVSSNGGVLASWLVVGASCRVATS
jgi:ubiquinone/menaquinone biosynthesis C-methylase UbiE